MAGPPELHWFDDHSKEPPERLEALAALFSTHEMFEWSERSVESFLLNCEDKLGPPHYFIQPHAPGRHAAWATLSCLFQFHGTSPFLPQTPFETGTVPNDQHRFHAVARMLGLGETSSIEGDLSLLHALWTRLPTLDFDLDVNQPIDPRLAPPLFNALLHGHLPLARLLVGRGATTAGCVTRFDEPLDVWQCLLTALTPPRAPFGLLHPAMEHRVERLKALLQHPPGQGETAFLKGTPFCGSAPVWKSIISDWNRAGQGDTGLSAALEAWIGVGLCQHFDHTLPPAAHSGCGRTGQRL
jgi:hypothetical protein